MKNAIIVLFTATVLVGCRKSNPVQPGSNTLYLKGHIGLYSGPGVIDSNSSGIEVAVLRTRQVQYTDSSGNYTFTNISPGTYQIEFDYSNYPPVIIPNYKVSYTHNVCQVTGSVEAPDFDGFGIGPICTTVPQIDSALLQWQLNYNIFTGVFSDSEVFDVYLSRTATDTSAILSPFNLLFIGKSAQQVEYSKDDYDDPYFMAIYLSGVPQSYASTFFPLTMSYLSSRGFAKGDSIYLRVYPLTGRFTM